MGLPESIRVKLLSEEAGAVSLTRVLARELPARELLDLLVAKVGKSPSRIRRLLRSGTLVSGASRYRWEGLETSEEEVRRLLADYPDPQPDRPFSASGCALVVLRLKEGGSVELPPGSLQRRRVLRRRDYWGVLVRLAEAAPPRYVDYSYREKADRFRMEIPAETMAALREAASLLQFSGLAKRLERSDVTAIDFYLRRSG